MRGVGYEVQSARCVVQGAGCKVWDLRCGV